MLNPFWGSLSLVASISGVLIILAPKLMSTLNKQLNQAIVSCDELIMKYRHVIGTVLLLTAYLCFHLALSG